MKLEEGALQAYREGKIIKDSDGNFYQICSTGRWLSKDPLPLSLALLRDWEIIGDKKEQLKKMIIQHAKEIFNNGYGLAPGDTVVEKIQPTLDFIEKLEIK